MKIEDKGARAMHVNSTRETHRGDAPVSFQTIYSTGKRAVILLPLLGYRSTQSSITVHEKKHKPYTSHILIK